MSQPIEREFHIAAEPALIYAALLDAKVFSKITGAPAEIEARPGGAFSNFGGVINGRNIELVQDRTIVQAWRVKFWPQAEYSIVRFDLAPAAGGTHVKLQHKGFPAEMRGHLNGELSEGGWDRQYLEPLRKHFE